MNSAYDIGIHYVLWMTQVVFQRWWLASKVSPPFNLERLL